MNSWGSGMCDGKDASNARAACMCLSCSRLRLSHRIQTSAMRARIWGVGFTDLYSFAFLLSTCRHACPPLRALS